LTPQSISLYAEMVGILSDSLPPLSLNQNPVDPPPVDPPLPVDPPAPIDPLTPIDPPLPVDPLTPIDPPPPVDPPPDSPFANQPQFPSIPSTSPLTVPQSPAAPPPSVPVETKKGLPIKKLILTLLILIILGFGGTGLVLAYTDYKPFTPPEIIKNSIDKLIIVAPLPKTPRLILEESQTKMASVKTAVLEIESEFSTTSASFPIKGAKFQIKGPFDLKTQNQAGVQLEVSGEVSFEGMQLAAAGEIRQIQDNLYFKLTQFPMGSFLPLDQFKNQWFFVNVKDLNRENQPVENQQDIQKLIEIMQNFQAKSYQWAKLAESQKDVYVLKINPPKSEIDNLLFEIIQVLEPKDQTKLEDSIQKSKLEDLTKNLQNIELTMKVGKKDYLVQEGSFSLSFDVDAPASLFPATGSVSLAPTTKVPISISITSKLSNYNQPVIVQIPDGAKDIKQYTQEFEKSLPSTLPNFQLPGQSLPGASPAPQSGIRDFLSTPSPVLGEKKYWDLEFLNSLGQIF